MKSRIFLVAVFVVVAAAELDLPQNLRNNPCYRYSNNLNECLLRRFRAILPYLVSGSTTSNIECLDPLKVGYFTFEGPKINRLIFNAKLSDIVVVGHKKTIINSVTLNPQSLEGTLDAFVPYIHISTNYDSFGRYGNFPLIDEGHFEGEIWNVSLVAKYKLQEIRKGSKKYLQCKSAYFTKVESSKNQINLESHVKHAEWLGVLISKYFNANYELLADILRPHVQEAAGNFYAMAVTHMMSAIPSDTLLS